MLSKSRFLAGLQCRLRLWYQCYQPQLACEISPGKQALFNTGHNVGKVATRLYPGGILIKEGYRRHDQAVRTTAAFMQDVQVPWIAFKILAAGAIPAEDGFEYAFASGADFVCVGMFDFQVGEDVELTRKCVAAAKGRKRAWA